MLNKRKSIKKQKGFGVAEMLIVILVIAILVVLALPTIISSRSSSYFAEVRKQALTSLLTAQKEAMTQGAPIVYRYDNINKQIVIYGGNFGGLGDFRNQVFKLESEGGVSSGKVTYGRPSGAPATPLSDGINTTPLFEGAVEIRFQPTGAIMDENNNLQDKSMFFYNSNNPKETAFAISVKGNGEQIKIWRYSPAINDYIE